MTPLTKEKKNILQKIATAIRVLSIDGVQKANSGHPGLPLGCAEIGAYLYGYALKKNPKNPDFMNRDRFILSGGHGSMWLYSCLFLAGYNLTLDDLKSFRQLHSKTPGHPEKQDTEGVETTTGPLGQGVANAVGQALGFKIIQEKFNKEELKIFDSHVVALMTDGCVMEGVGSEASCLAGHLKLNNLILFYDCNHICLDGPVKEVMSEDTKKRFEAYGFYVQVIDGNEFDAIHEAYENAKNYTEGPALIIAETIIGKGSPHKAGTNKVHGAPLGEEEVKATKEALGVPLTPFYIPDGVEDYFSEKRDQEADLEQRWNELFLEYEKKYPEDFRVLMDHITRQPPADLEEILGDIDISSPIAGRKASNIVINEIAKSMPYIYGGSADLSCSDLTMMTEYSVIQPRNYSGRNIKFGVREFAMGLMATGLSQTGLITPFVGTFFTFSDYMRNAIRMAALMKERVIYQFTHDSIFLGEDGPTHQPIEHLASLRAVPFLHVIRPADDNEVKGAWLSALNYQGPTAIILSRQNLPSLSGCKKPFREGVGRGAYIVKGSHGTVDFTLVATGSEVSLAIEVAEALEKEGKSVRVISMPCWEIFEKQDKEYQESLFGSTMGQGVSIEAAAPLGWHKFIGRKGITIGMETFGTSAPYKDVKEYFGFTVDKILKRILA